ncbi:MULTISPECIES: SDR family NAD(P)-dependent oxidoreductase [Protofrankia]|uniref:Short-chain dehydrogenase/reductase SDR n=1 Tax=Candidatus Protofrankia datiscae TaxID=2716812 RepID=F8AUW0_9ACTN|nr:MULTISPECIES: SDR family oxidoreductase [Protofrankia]AEH08158.1 short-chain dehydrogenase/reductase SDR [Candidatus Protofrankia datiscae]
MPRNVLITGGSSGVGLATVTRFARNGDNVWFTYHSRRDVAESVASDLRTTDGARIRAFEFRQGERDSHDALLAALPGPVDVLVNNAAVGTRSIDRYIQDPRDRDEAFLRINSIGPLWLIRRLLPGMLERGYGKIVNICSVGGGVAQFPGFDVVDGMSKAALAYLTRHLAAETAHSPVDVMAVCPGAVDTPMLRESTLDRLAPQARLDFEANLPKGRLIRPEEIAELVWWLCGNGSGVLHGAVVDASMGLGVRPGLLAEHSAESDRVCGGRPGGR